MSSQLAPQNCSLCRGHRCLGRARVCFLFRWLQQGPERESLGRVSPCARRLRGRDLCHKKKKREKKSRRPVSDDLLKSLGTQPDSDDDDETACTYMTVSDPIDDEGNDSGFQPTQRHTSAFEPTQKHTSISVGSETDSCTRNSSSCKPTCSVAHFFL